MASNGFEVLHHRVAHLDRSADGEIYSAGDVEGQLDPDAVWFTEVLGTCNDWTATTEPGTNKPIPSGIDPREADAITEKCALIQRLRAQAPRVVDGPVDLTAQQWVHHRPDHLPRRPEFPTAEAFVPVTAATVTKAATKPWEVGFFTSTGAWHRHSMWRVYQHAFYFMYPAPLPAWRMHVEPGVAVYEIGCAVDWVRFVADYPKIVDDRAYPDWPAVAKDWDAVHFTAFAIAATQGLVFPLGKAAIQPLLLDTEQTFWLSWRFTEATPMRPGPLDLD
jgi:hypothetical protein